MAVEVAIATLSPIVGTARACRAVGRPRSSWYRHHRTSPAPPRPPCKVSQPQPRALHAAERQQVLGVLHAERFWDAVPASVYATLLDEGTYLASSSTMYRLLTGWHRHHHRSGLTLPIDTTSGGWDYYLATSGDLYLATSGDFSWPWASLLQGAKLRRGMP